MAKPNALIRFKKRWILKDKEHKCHYCQVKINLPPELNAGGRRMKPNDLTIDHFIPLVSGGTNSVHNFFVSCFECNQFRSKLYMANHIRKMELIEWYIKKKPTVAECPDFFKYVFKYRQKPKPRFITNYG